MPNQLSKTWILPLFFAVVCGSVSAAFQDSGEAAVATFTIDVNLGESGMDGVWVTLECGLPPVRQAREWIEDAGTRVLEVAVGAGESLDCVVAAAPESAQWVEYRGDGGSDSQITDRGCRFTAVRAGHANFCQLRRAHRLTSVTVFKKWIGTTRTERDLPVQLSCSGGVFAPEQVVNAGRPASWELDLTDPNGVVCTVSEQLAEDFVADQSDCSDLLVLPGAQEECTLVNTKVIKMIDMLNRYGLFIMIGVFMVAGMIASRRMVV